MNIILNGKVGDYFVAIQHRVTTVAAVLLVLIAQDVFAKKYYVAPDGKDSNPGTLSKPWRTIGKANNTLQPGDTVLIRSATYNEQIRPVRSGTSDSNRIIYKAYGDGDVILASFPSADGPEEGAIALGQRNYITVSGRADGDSKTKKRIRLIPSKDIMSLGNVCGSEGVIVENIYAECSDKHHSCSRGFSFCINYWHGSYETKYNVLRNSRIIGFSDLSDNPMDYTEDLITIAKKAHHNLIANNILELCRHSVLYADSPNSHSNVFRDNIIKNPQHTALSIWSAGVELDEGARFLVENNYLEASGRTQNPHGGPGNAFQWGSDELIIRYNTITQGGSDNNQNRTVGGLVGATSTSYGAPYFASDGRVYNNSIVKNRGVAIGMFDFRVNPVDLGRHKFINNIYYDSQSSATDQRLVEYWDEKFSTSDLYINNVFGNPGGKNDQIMISTKMGATNLKTAVATYRNPENPEFTTWNGFNNVYDHSPGFNNYKEDDYSLPSGNKYIDAGAYLTTVQSGCGTSTITVGDSRFFYAEASEFPAWMNVKMDWVAIGSRLSDATKRQIKSVEDANNQLKFESEVNCKKEDRVWLWKNSRGKRVVYGAAPDMGASEYLSLDENIGIPPPKNLKIKIN